MMKIYPYNDGSASAKALAGALNVKRLLREGKDIHVKGSILNWGNSAFYREMTYENELLNHPDAVAKAVNKLEAFKTLDGSCPIPKWTESAVEALKWLDEGQVVVVRNKLTGHSGEGIVICEPGGDKFKDNIEAPLYTQYIKKVHEYRLHVFLDKVFFVQRKARNREVPDEQVNWQVRNHANGFIFAHQDVDVPDIAKQHAIDAVRVLGLDFGAVDIICNKRLEWFILEVNTACGLEGTTLEKYVEVFKEFV